MFLLGEFLESWVSLSISQCIKCFLETIKSQEKLNYTVHFTFVQNIFRESLLKETYGSNIGIS